MSEITKLRQLQLEEIEACRAFIDFCEEKKLTYYLRGGSVLGAIKYNGMIPWDDDIDVVLPRKDYNTFINIAPDKFNNARFEHYSRNSKLNCYFARLYLDEEVRIKKDLPRNNACGLVLVDILPIDGIPTNKMSFLSMKLRVNTMRLLASVHTLDHKDTVVKRSGLKKVIPVILNKLKVHKLYKQVDIYKKLEKIYSKYPFENAENVGVLAGSKSDREIYPKKWLASGEYHLFENMKARIPKQYEDYLKLIFGVEYMKNEPNKKDGILKHFAGEL